MDDVTNERARSLKFVQIVFAFLAILSVAASLFVSVRGDELGLPDTSVHTISVAFLIVGVMDTALLFVWERIFQRMHS
jgi:O-antigen/teichoic acid export membrane protein